MRRALILLPLALFGMLSAHQLAYVSVAPDQLERAALLQHTGHGWLSHLGSLWLLAGAGILAVAWTLVRQSRRAPRPWEILLLQTLAYSTVEAGERIAGGQSPWPGWELLTAGIIAQLPSALASWAVLALVVMPLIASLRHTLTFTWSAVEPPTVTWQINTLPVRILPSGATARAPPA